MAYHQQSRYNYNNSRDSNSSDSNNRDSTNRDSNMDSNVNNGGRGDNGGYFQPVRRQGRDRYNDGNNDRSYNNNRRQPKQYYDQPPEPYSDVEIFIKPEVNYKMTDEELNDLQLPINSFEDLELSDVLMRGIFSYGFEQPSPIQAKSIRPVMSGRDIIAQAQSGMGKTGAFTIGTLSRVDENVNATQAIILAHTRELALQIDTVFRQISTHTNIRINMCLKGIPVHENIEKLSGVKGGKPHIIIGTPGRILDMLKRRDMTTGHPIINQSAIRMLVVDEADEILGTTNESMQRANNQQHGEDRKPGFLDQIYTIFQYMPRDIQVCLFSATMSPEFFELTKKFMREPIKVLVKTEELTLDGIKQYYIDVEENKFKFDTLCELYGLLTINQSIIYCNSMRSVEYLTNMLQKNNFMVSCIHGQMTPIERELTMSDFRSGKSRVLVSTDLLSRGIDVQQVSVVINYDIPTKIESYLHRIGRSGRYGRKGVAINFMTRFDNSRVKNIEQYYSTQIEPLPADIQNLLN